MYNSATNELQEIQEWNTGARARRQTATRLSRTCFNLTMKYELYPLDNGKPLENLK